MHDLTFWLVAVAAVFMVGLSKSGLVASMGLIAVPLLAQVMPPRDAAGMMLPLLLVMDAIAIWTYRRDANWNILKIMVPGAHGRHHRRLGALERRHRCRGQPARRHRSRWRSSSGRCRRSQEDRQHASLKALGHVLGRRRRLHELHQPHRRPAVPDLRAAAAALAGHLLGDDRLLLRHRQHRQSSSPTASSASSTSRT